MSTFEPVPVDCPRCGHTTERFLATSLNYARGRSHFDAIVAGTFQRYACPRCAAQHEVDRPFLAMHLRQTGPGRFLIAQHPHPWITDFQRAEHDVLELYANGLGEHAPSPARGLGKDVVIRVVFGLDALREKVLCLLHGLDDVALELLKLRALRELPEAAVDLTDPPRLLDVQDDALTFRWPQADGDGLPGLLTLDRRALAEIDVAGSPELVALVRGPAFVDLARLWLPHDASSVELA